jgi:hypothetical protein
MVLKSRLPQWAWVAISIAVVAVCDVLNFSDMMWGNGSVSSFVVSLAYVLIWAALVFINRYNGKYLALFTVFSLICVVTGLLGLGLSSEIISNEVLRAIGMVGVTLFLTPLYGFRFVINNGDLVLLYTAIILLSAIGIVFGFLLARNAKRATLA